MKPKLERLLAKCVAAATKGAWHAETATFDGTMLVLPLEGAAGPLTLEIRPAETGRPCYRTIGAHAYSYRTTEAALSRRQHLLLDDTITALSAVLARVRPEKPRALASADEGAVSFPTPYHRYHLENEVALAPEVIDAYRRDGHVLVRGALARDVVLAARPLLLAALKRSWPAETRPLDERSDAYSQAFVQVVNIGLEDEAVGAFSHSRRLGRMAAELMGVSGVRIFAEDWLLKEPGAGITPWHQDAAVYPLRAAATLTIWIPIQDIPAGMGLVRFARGSHRFGLAPVENISDVSQEAFDRIIAAEKFPIEDCPPVRAGDVSFHDGTTMHAAFPNDSSELRAVLALHCFADGAIVTAPETDAMAHQLADFAPELQPGDAAVSPKWPLIYASRDPSVGRVSVGSTPAYHLRATLLPGDEVPVDLWIQDGRFRTRPLAEAREVALTGGFAISGLVDMHCHVSWPHDRDTPAHTAEFMNRQRADCAATGVTALRDMGAAGDEILELGDQPGLPRVHASGMLVLPHDAFPFTPTSPAMLRRVFLERIERGARWVKVFSDWSQDYRGKDSVGFAERDGATYPLPLLRDAVAAAHAAGGRVAAHCFTRAGAEVAIHAGCDSLEHGWGLDEVLIDEMAAHGIAWVPLLGIAGPMWRAARRDDEPERARWVEASMERLVALLPHARRCGVRIFAGTDWFPEVTVADEIRELHALGLPAEEALAAGSWAARAWLGEPAIEDGAPADLVLYATDPRRSLDALEQPALILIGGRPVTPTAARVRSRRLGWSDRAAAR